MNKSGNLRLGLRYLVKLSRNMDANCPRLLMIIAVAPLPLFLARSLISIPAYCRLARKKPFPSLVRPTADAVITLRASSFTNEFIIAATAATEKRTKRTEGAARSRMRTSHSNPFRRLTFAFKSPFGEMEALLFKYCIKALSINLLADFRESRAFSSPGRREACANATKMRDTQNPAGRSAGFSLHKSVGQCKCAGIHFPVRLELA